MTLNTQKEDFSYAYVYAVTAAAGYSLQTATRRLDDSGIDATITVPGKLNSKRLPRFDIQIKSTSQNVTSYHKYPRSFGRVDCLLYLVSGTSSKMTMPRRS